MTRDEPVPFDLDPPPVAGRYHLGAVIGIGSSAVVHRAWDLHTGGLVAVKLFHPGASVHDLRRQRQEMSALARLDHPGLVALRDGGSENGRPFVVTDLVEGSSLAERILDGPIPVGEVRDIGARLADALAHVHANGILHRDVKPANILLGDGVRPRLADFGIARVLDATATATATGWVTGTAAYLAPEQVRGEGVGPPADVYALGLVLLEALTGIREFPGHAVESAMARLHRRPVVPTGLPAGLGVVLSAMTAIDSRERPTAAAVAGLLAARDRGPRTDTMRAPRRPGRCTRLAAARIAAAALVLVAAVGGMAVLTGADAHSEPQVVAAGPISDPAQAAAVPPTPPAAMQPVASRPAPVPVAVPVAVARVPERVPVPVLIPEPAPELIPEPETVLADVTPVDLGDFDVIRHADRAQGPSGSDWKARSAKKGGPGEKRVAVMKSVSD